MALQLICLFSMALLLPSKALAEEPIVAFTKAKNSFDSGTYEQAVERFESLLESDMNNPALMIETHKYLGVSYLFVGNEQGAEQQFLLLLNQLPEYQLDPLVFPIDVVDFFTEVKRKHAQNLKKIQEAKARADAERKKREERRRKAELARLRQYVYIEKEVTLKSKVVAMMPFGAGQFQNGHKRKGLVFLIGQSVLLTSSAVTFALHESLRDEAKNPFYSEAARKDYEKLEKGYRIANQVSLASFCVMVLVGIVDSIYHFNQTETRWHEVDENEVPERFKPANRSISLKHIGPVFTGDSAGVGALVFF